MVLPYRVKHKKSRIAHDSSYRHCMECHFREMATLLSWNIMPFMIDWRVTVMTKYVYFMNVYKCYGFMPYLSLDRLKF
jgi:hypothetical protein